MALKKIIANNKLGPVGHGGKRPGSGRPKIESTTKISFHVPAKLKADAKEKHGDALPGKFTSWLNEITYDKTKHDA